MEVSTTGLECETEGRSKNERKEIGDTKKDGNRGVTEEELGGDEFVSIFVGLICSCLGKKKRGIRDYEEKEKMEKDGINREDSEGGGSRGVISIVAPYLVVGVERSPTSLSSGGR
uniref:Uncharacterized protein n=1 Tax=Vespula pensylvanica TaxID=30213 RepID=A0A834PH43_VESPE|nr:hypothetical protein H0235_002020 [Vespula pensylvanica]